MVERKVPLPTKWIKGLTTVQLFLAEAERVFTFNRIQMLQLFQSMPNGKAKTDYYLVMRASNENELDNDPCSGASPPASCGQACTSDAQCTAPLTK